MPTAAAVAAAAATAKIQAMDAVASNAMVLGLSKLTTAAPLQVAPLPAAAPPARASPLAASPGSAAALIPPPGVAIPQLGNTPPLVHREKFTFKSFSQFIICINSCEKC